MGSVGPVGTPAVGGGSPADAVVTAGVLAAADGAGAINTTTTPVVPDTLAEDSTYFDSVFFAGNPKPGPNYPEELFDSAASPEPSTTSAPVPPLAELLEAAIQAAAQQRQRAVVVPQRQEITDPLALYPDATWMQSGCVDPESDSGRIITSAPVIDRGTVVPQEPTTAVSPTLFTDTRKATDRAREVVQVAARLAHAAQPQDAPSLLAALSSTSKTRARSASPGSDATSAVTNAAQVAEATTAPVRPSNPSAQAVVLASQSRNLAQIVQSLASAPTATTLSPADAVALVRHARLAAKYEEALIRDIAASAVDNGILRSTDIRSALQPLVTFVVQAHAKPSKVELTPKGKELQLTPADAALIGDIIVTRLSEQIPAVGSRGSAAIRFTFSSLRSLFSLDANPSPALRKILENLLWGAGHLPLAQVIPLFQAAQSRMVVDLRAALGVQRITGRFWQEAGVGSSDIEVAATTSAADSGDQGQGGQRGGDAQTAD